MAEKKQRRYSKGEFTEFATRIQNVVAGEDDPELDKLVSENPELAKIAGSIAKSVIAKEPAAKEEVSQQPDLTLLPNPLEGSDLQAAGQVAASAAYQIPTDIAGGIDFFRAAGSTALRMATEQRAKDETFTKALADTFIDEMYTDGGMERVQQHVMDAQEQIAKQHPNATVEQIQMKMQKYTEGDAFNDFLLDQMTPGFKLALKTGNYMNKLVGVDKRVDQQTLAEDVLGVFAQAVVPTSLVKLPAKYGMKQASKFVSKSVLEETSKLAEKITSTKAGRVAAKTARGLGTAAEIVLPGTSPYTKKRVAANAVVGAGITEGMRVLTDRPSVTGYVQGEDDLDEILVIGEDGKGEPLVERNPDLLKPDVANGEPPHGHGVDPEDEIDTTLIGGAASIAALFSFPGFRNRVVQQAQQAAQQQAQNMAAAVPSAVSRMTGQTIKQQKLNEGILGGEPQLSTFTGKFDKNAPLKKAANMFKPAGDKESVDAIDFIASSGDPIKRQEAYANTYYHGELINVANTLPLKQWETDFLSLAKPKQEQLANYYIAKQADRAMANKIAEQQRIMLDAQNRHRVAVLANKGKEARAAAKEYQAARQAVIDAQTDAPSARPIKNDWDEATRNAIIRQAEGDPEIMAIVNKGKLYMRDLAGMRVHNGLDTTQEGIDMLTANPVYHPIWEVAHPEVQNTLARKALLFKDRAMHDLGMKGQHIDPQMYRPRAQRDLSPDKSVVVNQPIHPVSAFRMATQDAIDEVVVNTARRDAIDMLRQFPGAEGQLFRKFEFEVGNHRTHQISKEQFQAIEGYKKVQSRDSQPEHQGNPLVPVLRDGKLEFWEFFDGSIARTLAYQPTLIVPVMNTARKAFQIGTTAWAAPWFAPIAFMRDTAVALTSKNANMSFGLIDTYGRRLAKMTGVPDKVLEQTFGRVADPTAIITAGGAVPYKVTMDAMEAAGNAIAETLRQNSNAFRMFDAVLGQDFTKNLGQLMQRVFDDSAYKVYKYKASTQVSSVFVENVKRMDDYDVVEASKSGKAFSALISTARYFADCLQQANRIALFAQNFNPNMSKAQLNKLLHQVNNATADLSRTGQSTLLQGTSSVVPFAGASIQGTRHMFSMAMPRSLAKVINKGSKAITGKSANMIEEKSNHFWSMLATGVGIPTVASMVWMNNWPGANDWWYNQVPNWKRATGIPFPNYKALEYYYQNGQLPPFHPDYVNKFETAPDYVLIKAPFVAAMRYLGLTGPDSAHVPYSLMQDMRSALGQFVPAMMPPPAAAVLAGEGFRANPSGLFSGDPMLSERAQPPLQGGNPDQMDFNSLVPKWVGDVVSTLFGTAGNVAIQTFNVGITSIDEGMKFQDAVSQMFETAKYEAKRHAPEIDIPVLYDSVKRYYTANPEGNYVHETEDVTLAPIIGQHGIDTPTGKAAAEMAEEAGLEAPPKLNDPALQAMSDYVYQQLKMKGPYKKMTDMYSVLSKQISILEGNRYKLPTKEYHQTRNKYVLTQQKLNTGKSKILYQLEKDMQDRFGQQFEQMYGVPMSYETLADLVRQNVVEQ